MNIEISALLITAASIGFFHTVFGPDHYLPFVMLSWAKKWSGTKTAVITLLCGIGHIASSIVLGFIGISIGIAVNKLEVVESVRGNIAAWLLISFGLVYLIWGLRRAYRNRPHEHRHFHPDKSTHSHEHHHHDEHVHIHEEKAKINVTTWTLFIIFIFGPCEPLIPLLMYPAAKHNMHGVILVTAVFGITTILTMLSFVLLMRAGFKFVKLSILERYTHAIAGAMILLCGLSIQFLGL